MSSIIEFFVAPHHEAAAAAVEFGPSRDPESPKYGNFDVEEALIEWEALLTGRSFDELVSAGEPEPVADSDGEGPFVLALSEALQDALAGADRARLDEVGGLWIEERAADGEEFDVEITAEILDGLATLARDAIGRGRRVYCWTA
ncbi:hypothetical protein [Streptomyces fructofermentans]|uniref:hypothetical protein n=1 Tax=Streptomyces fructofermentans TaxID=152141 RepID=UPI001676DCC9|nr:hypothetical protein [Streptomyces fructofermentans]